MLQMAAVTISYNFYSSIVPLETKCDNALVPLCQVLKVAFLGDCSLAIALKEAFEGPRL